MALNSFSIIKILFLFALSIEVKSNEYPAPLLFEEEFRFSNLYQDGMVLQRSPESATIWGYGKISEESEAKVSCSSNFRLINTFSVIPTLEGDAIWKLELSPQKGGTICNIEVSDGFGNQITINEAIYGDVYLCSGQSNMEFEMGSINNAKEEMEISSNYTNIRYTRIRQASLNEPDDKLDIDLAHNWSDPSNQSNLKKMSAVCFLYARNIYDKLEVPLGLIDSAYGGTPIESWSSIDMLDVCGLGNDGRDYSPKGPTCKGCLYNKMIYPMRRTTLKGFLWYQGEKNANYHRDKYNCTFPAKIDGWRSVFSSNSNTSPDAPYGFVQLSTDQYGNQDLSFPLIRWHQTSDYGFVPNQRLEHVFMAVAIDTYDGPNGVHPHWKQIVGERLAISGMNVAYGDDRFPTNGPMIQTAEVLSGPILALTYNQRIKYSKKDLSGFYYCCTDYDNCDRGSNRNWFEVSDRLVEFNDNDESGSTINIDIGELVECEIEVPHIAYLWRQSPFTHYLGAPIYSKDSFSLPAAPWKMSSNNLKSTNI